MNNTLNILGKEYNIDEIKDKYHRDFYGDIVKTAWIKTELGTFRGTIINAININEVMNLINKHRENK